MKQNERLIALSLRERVDAGTPARGEGMARNFMTPLASILLCLCFGTPTFAATISLEDYRAKLEKLDAALSTENLAETKRIASELDAVTIKSPTVSFDSDPTVIAPLKNASAPTDLTRIRPRVKRLIDALQDLTAAAPKSHASDPISAETLERLRRDEAIAMPSKDGEISGEELVESQLSKSIIEALKSAWQWFSKTMDAIFKWLKNLFPKIDTSSGSAETTTLIIKILVVAFAVTAISIVVYILMRRNQWNSRPLDGIAHAPAESAKDADPTSRNTNEWETYAAQLAASGRHREAIRACYHAVLTSLFRAGILHHRKGRTNWEYCYALPLNVSWRDRFFDLTGFFEVEWYGKIRSEPEDFSTYAAATKQLLAQARNGKEGAA